jgi:hypothetical protein
LDKKQYFGYIFAFTAGEKTKEKVNKTMILFPLAFGIFVLLHLGEKSVVAYDGSMTKNTCKRLESFVSNNCDCNYYKKYSCNKPNCDNYGDGEGSSYRPSNDDRYEGYNGEGGSYRKKNGYRELSVLSTTMKEDEGDNSVLDLKGTINRSRDLCGKQWETRCECCCGKLMCSF